MPDEEAAGAAAFGQEVAILHAHGAGPCRAKRRHRLPEARQVELLVDHELVLDLRESQVTSTS